MKSKFATVNEIFSESFAKINAELIKLNRKFELFDHSELNKQRFDWHDKININPVYYGARFWEFPFAILGAELSPGLKCADIGCGSTPFTAYLCDKVGKENVTGFDPDYVDDNPHSSFGAKKSFIQELGFSFKQNNMTNLDSPDECFDRVFCISVLEHITSPEIKKKGLAEMVRILKPGGKLILTFDLGINLALNDPFDIIRLTGLIPDGEIDFQWPKNRFVNYGDNNVDVFGLILKKEDTNIFSNYSMTKRIKAHEGYMLNAALAHKLSGSYSEYLMNIDLKRPFGKLRVISKLLLNKYKR